MSTVLTALMLSVIAGVFNGSWGTPPKYMKKWSEEVIWFTFSFFGFLILPWLTIFILSPSAYKLISHLPSNLLLIMFTGGIIFGLSQVFFAIAFKYIGVGINYVINISMGTAGAAIIPFLWHQDLIGTYYFYLQFAGIVLFIIAVCIGAIAGAIRDKGNQSDKTNSKKNKVILYLLIGVFYSILAGIGSACQGITYIIANPEVSRMGISLFHLPILAANVISWVIIFSCAWIPFVIYFLFFIIKNKSYTNYSSPGKIKYWIFSILMGCGFWCGLIFFCKASVVIGGDLAPTITWPLFMVFIILVSNIWGWLTGEWKNAKGKAVFLIWLSIIIFIVAISVFSYSSKMKPKGEHRIVHPVHIRITHKPV